MIATNNEGKLLEFEKFFEGKVSLESFKSIGKKSPEKSIFEQYLAISAHCAPGPNGVKTQILEAFCQSGRKWSQKMNIYPESMTFGEPK